MGTSEPICYVIDGETYAEIETKLAAVTSPEFAAATVRGMRASDAGVKGKTLAQIRAERATGR